MIRSGIVSNKGRTRKPRQSLDNGSILSGQMITSTILYLMYLIEIGNGG